MKITMDQLPDAWLSFCQVAWDPRPEDIDRDLIESETRVSVSESRLEKPSARINRDLAAELYGGSGKPPV